MSSRLVVRRPVSFGGTVRVPADKSMTHRAFLLAAIADGPSRVVRPLQSVDCLATLRCLQAMGLTYEWISENEIALHPASEWTQPAGALDCGNSGTTMRLLSGLIASRPLSATLVGDASLSKRPMGRIAEPLRLMGAKIEGETPPLRIEGSDSLQGIDYHTPVASAQIKSCILLAALRAEGLTTVTEPQPSRDHTERMLAATGVKLDVGGTTTQIEGGQTVSPFVFEVPGDISSAAFFAVAAATVPGAEVTLVGAGLNPTRTGLLDVFEQSGLSIRPDHVRASLGEPVADLMVRHEGIGMPFEISGGLVPRLVDEIPVLAVLATQLDGVSHIRDAGELRVKESDRIETVAAGLRSMGAEVETYEDGLSIGGPTRLQGTTIQAGHDHRIGMAFAVAGLVADGETVIEGADCIATSYPEFENNLWRLCVF